MSKSSLVVIWLLFFLAIFAIGYITTHVIVTKVMADFTVKETGYTTLEVKPNYGNQTDYHYKLQPATNVSNLGEGGW